MHVCETLWPRVNGADRKDITKIYGAAPADPFSTLRAYDASSRGPIWTFQCVYRTLRAHPQRRARIQNGAHIHFEFSEDQTQ